MLRNKWCIQNIRVINTWWTHSKYYLIIICGKNITLSESCFIILTSATAAAKSLQSCLTLYDPIDGSPPGSLVPGILQARTLEWVAISFSNACRWKEKVKSLSRVRLLETPRTIAYQAPPSMGFSRQEYWSGVPSPSPDISKLLLNISSLPLPQTNKQTKKNNVGDNRN